MRFLDTDQRHQFCRNKLIQYISKLQSRTMIQIVPNERDCFIYHKVCCYKRLPSVKQFFVGNLRNFMIGVVSVGQGIPSPCIDKNRFYEPHLGHSRKKITHGRNASALEWLWLFYSEWIFYFLEKP